MLTKTIAMSATILIMALGAEARVETGQHAIGTFEVKVTPVSGADNGAATARMSLEKSFSGDLTGTSKGEMWTTDPGVEGSGGYVAIEKVKGTLRGRSGSFTLIHQGTMRRGTDFQLRIVVVPDSGTDQLGGLEGTMTIRIEKGAHSYDFEYTLPASP